MTESYAETGFGHDTSPVSDRARMLVGVAIPLASAAASLLPIVLWRSALPDRIATHWDLAGEPDNDMSLNGFIVLVTVGLVLAAALLGGAAFARTRRWPMAWGALIGATLAGILPVVSLTTVLANRHAATWTEARSLSPWIVATSSILATMIMLGVVGRGIRGLLLTGGHHAAGEHPTAGLRLDPARGHTAAWNSGASARWPWLIAGVMVAIGGAVAWLGAWPIGIVLVVTSLVSLAFLEIRTTVDRRGLTVRYPMVPGLRNAIPLESIASVEAIDVRPMTHGGWGYRGSLKLLGKAAVVLRAGEGLRLRLTNGKEFVVSVDDAATGAGVLGDLLAADDPTGDRRPAR